MARTGTKKTAGVSVAEHAAPCIVIDTREQQPYDLGPLHGYGAAATDPGPLSVYAVSKALPAGDYSVVGYEDRIAVERKNLNDFVQTVTRSRQRFARELRKLAAMRHACIVVEGSLADVTAHRYTSAAHPASVLGAAVSICTVYGVPVYWCGDRQHALAFTRAFLLSAVEVVERRKRAAVLAAESKEGAHE